MDDASVSELPGLVRLLEDGIARGLHLGAQAYVSHRGRVLADLAVGESRPGVGMTAGALVLWMSAGKPITAVAVAQLWERGLLALDDPIARHISEFAVNGKAAITVRHVLTHTAGIRWVETGWPRASWEESIARVCAMRIERDWVPGRKAGYSALVSWFVLGELIRRLDGREFDRYVREEVFEPAGMNDSWAAMTADVYRAYGDRIGILYKTEGGGAIDMGLDTEAAATHARPSSSVRGPIRELGRFYETLLGGGATGGRSILRPQTVEALVSRHRVGLYDHTFRHPMDWGLGFVLNSAYLGGEPPPYGYGAHASLRTFGHGGSQSTAAFADPEAGLVVALHCNGCPGEPAHEQRMRDLIDACYAALPNGE